MGLGQTLIPMVVPSGSGRLLPLDAPQQQNSSREVIDETFVIYATQRILNIVQTESLQSFAVLR